MAESSFPGCDPHDLIVVRGAGALEGQLEVSGATKNSALSLMAAALLAEGETVIGNAPPVADLPVMADVLRALGCEVGHVGTEVRVVVGELGTQPPQEKMALIRASISVLGPLVGRAGRAEVALPGGDRIGARSIDMHLRGLVEMGADVAQRDGEVLVRAGRLRGARITLDFPSVGATKNLVMAAVLADGRTVIDNAAREPDVADLCRMLVAMGASVDGIGSATIAVEGVPSVRPVRHAAIPDRIEAGTFAVAAALTGGDVTLTGVRPDDLRLVILKLRAAGALVEEADDTIRVKGGELRACNFVTLPHPGFPTDLQPMMMVLLSQAMGTSMCTENVYESRFAFVDELAALGADVALDGHHALIRGPRALSGTRVRALDVRAGAALVLAGLVADGETLVTDVVHVDRGYHDLVGRLRSLGADVERARA